jgi:hypothetical protein
MGRIEDWMVAEEGLTGTLCRPTAPCALQLEERKEEEVMSSGSFGVV